MNVNESLIYLLIICWLVYWHLSYLHQLLYIIEHEFIGDNRRNRKIPVDFAAEGWGETSLIKIYVELLLYSLSFIAEWHRYKKDDSLVF